MTDDEFKRTPIASAPLSVLLMACDPQIDLEAVTARWVDFLRQLGNVFEVIVVAKTNPFSAPPAPESKTEEAAPPTADPAVNGETPQKKAKVHPLTQRFPEVRVLPVEDNGLGTLLRHGLAETKHPLVFWTRADQPYRPEDLKKLLEKIDQADVVTGVRTGKPIPWWLRAVDGCVSWFCLLLFGLPLEPRSAWLGWQGLSRRLLAYWCFGVQLYDPEGVFCLVRRDMLRRIVIQSSGSLAAIEFLAKANFLNGLLAQEPLAVAPVDDREPETTSFFQEAAALFSRPDFGPVKLAEPELQASQTPTDPQPG